MTKVIQIEVPEKLAVLIEKDELLRKLSEEVVKQKLTEYLLKVYALDVLAKDSELTEEDVMELDEKVKKGILKKWEDEVSG